MRGVNYYCKTYLNVLVCYYADACNDAKIKGMQTFLCSFNLDKALKSERDSDVFKHAVANAIEFHRSANSSSSLADVSMEEA